MFKHLFFAICAVMLAAAPAARAQSGSTGPAGLTGLTFARSDIFSVLATRMEQNKEDMIKKSVEDLEKKKGRTIKEKELANIKKNLDQTIGAFKAVRMDVTLVFNSGSEVESLVNVQVDDQQLKSSGMNWLNRKMFKLAFKAVPKSEKEKYIIRQDSLVISSPGTKDADTMILSRDSLQLAMPFDEGIKVILHRQL